MKNLPPLPPLPAQAEPAPSLPPIPNAHIAAPAITMRTFDKTPALVPDDISYIMSDTLKAEHRDDPLILKFIMSYLQNRDVKQASKDAGIALGLGRRFRNRKDIDNCINKITETQIMKYGYDTEEIVAKIKDIAFADPAELENPDGSYKSSLSELSPEFRRAIKKFKVKNLFDKDANGMNIKIGEIIEVELYDKMQSVELLDRAKDKVFKETKVMEHDVTANMASVLLEARDRAERKALEARQEMKDVIEVKNE